LTDINLTGGDTTNVDTSDHSISDGYREFVPGLKDGGTLELTGRYDFTDPGQTYFRDAFGTTATLFVEYSDGNGVDFSAIIGGMNAANSLDDASGFTASAKITGPVTDHESEAVAATITLNPTGDNNSVTFTAVTPGSAGNSITVALVVSEGEESSASPDVDGLDIIIFCGNLTTAQDVIDGVNGSISAAALVSASASGLATGLIAAVTATNLTGGAD